MTHQAKLLSSFKAAQRESRAANDVRRVSEYLNARRQLWETLKLIEAVIKRKYPKNKAMKGWDDRGDLLQARDEMLKVLAFLEGKD